MKIAIIGAGSSYTPELIFGLLDVSEQIDLREVWMHDIDERKLQIMYGFCQRLVKDRFKLFETKDFVEAVRESSYVVFQFRPGGLKAQIRRGDPTQVRFDWSRDDRRWWICGCFEGIPRTGEIHRLCGQAQ